MDRNDFIPLERNEGRRHEIIPIELKIELIEGSGIYEEFLKLLNDFKDSTLKNREFTVKNDKTYGSQRKHLQILKEDLNGATPKIEVRMYYTKDIYQ